MPDFIPVNTPLLDGNEKKYLNECIDTGWISSEGPFVKRFEKEMAELVGRKHAVAVCNGTAALDAAIAALDLKAGDEVILPTFTIISCASSIVRAGAVPVLVDSDPVTWNMDIEQVESRITPRTKAVMVVHIYGLPVDMDPLLELARKHGLKVVEDAAEAIGQTYKGKLCGSFGDISIFSFYPNKHITTGEGGMVVLDDESLAERCRGLRNLCFQKKRFVHEELGWNFRMSNLQAALGCAQLERLASSLVKKRSIGSIYNELLSDVDGIHLPCEKTDYADNVYWVYGVVLNDDANFNAEDVMSLLKEKGVGSRPFFWPMHEQPVFQKQGMFNGEKYPVAEKLARRGFYLPSGLGLRDDEIERVASTLKEVLSK